MASLEITAPKFIVCDPHRIAEVKIIDYYSDDIANVFGSKFDAAALLGTLTNTNIEAISQCFSEGMECGALTGYIFTLRAPKKSELTPEYVIDNAIGLKETMLEELEDEYYQENPDERRYLPENAEISVMKWGAYWITEVYFSH